MVMEIKALAACGWWIDWKRVQGSFWVMKMFYILIGVLLLWLCVFVKTH